MGSELVSEQIEREIVYMYSTIAMIVVVYSSYV